MRHSASYFKVSHNVRKINININVIKVTNIYVRRSIRDSRKGVLVVRFSRC